jgi:hypothetical protein
MPEKLFAAHAAAQLTFYGAHAALVDATGVRRESGSSSHPAVSWQGVWTKV